MLTKAQRVQETRIWLVILGIVGSFALYACTLYPPSGKHITIRNDDGGLLLDYSRSATNAESVRILGKCYSACAMYLTSKNVCVAPEAEFGFHGSWPRLKDPEAQEIRDIWFASHFPLVLRKPFMEEWRHRRPLSFHLMSAQELRALVPSIPYCT